jgi:hypothetical protein
VLLSYLSERHINDQNEVGKNVSSFRAATLPDASAEDRECPWTATRLSTAVDQNVEPGVGRGDTKCVLPQRANDRSDAPDKPLTASFSANPA